MSYRYPKLDPNIDGLLARNEMEYPTEDVSFTYLLIIDKINFIKHKDDNYTINTIDSFTDKALEVNGRLGERLIIMGRYADYLYRYGAVFDVNTTTSDYKIEKKDGTTPSTLASESVDLVKGGVYSSKFSIAGSTLSFFRDNTIKLTTTDTTFTSGSFGYGEWDTDLSYYDLTQILVYLRPPSTQLPPAQRILEFEITGAGTDEDPIRPNFSQNIQDHPEFGKIDTLSVTWGAFDYKDEPTILTVITGDNYYQQGAILEQESYVKNKNLKVFRPPRDLLEAKQLHSQIKSERPDIIAGSHNLAYQCIGHPDLEPLAVADFYDGFVQGTYNIKELDKVPQWELERTIKMWEKRLELSSITSTEKDKHFPRLRSVIKI